MSKGNTTENDVLKMILKGVDPSWRSNANRYLAFHTADPGEAGNQTTNEADYTAYARVAVPLADWTDGGATFTNAGLVQFPKCLGGSNTLTHFSIGTASSGAGQILISGALSSSLIVSNNIQPQIAIGELSISED